MLNVGFGLKGSHFGQATESAAFYKYPNLQSLTARQMQEMYVLQRALSPHSLKDPPRNPAGTTADYADFLVNSVKITIL
jgi:hypothetical protein